MSERILLELERTLQTPYFRRRLSSQDIAEALTLLRDEATPTSITTHVTGVATHPEDDLILATAVSAQADYLITGDLQLQRLGAYEGVTILSPALFSTSSPPLQRWGPRGKNS